MSSLNQLAAAHRTLLVLDTASARTQAGLIQPGHPPAWTVSEGEANSTLFQCIERVLGGRSVQEIDAFVFCEGPGSILGIRTAAVALRTWSALRTGGAPMYAYRSLDLVARELVRRGTPPPFNVIADARRDSWHCVEVRSDGPAPLRRVPAGELAASSAALFTPAGFRAWTQPPRPAQPCAYDLAALFAALADADCLHPTATPDAFLYEDPAYQTWTPEIHRAPTSVR